MGSHLCELLIASGFDVVCVDNFSTGCQENIKPLMNSPRFELIQADVTEACHVCGPVGYVFHLASPASPIDYLRLPLETLRAGSLGTENALRLARGKGARFLIASTSEVYGDPEVHPQRESYWGRVNPIGPRAVYDEAKRYAEAVTMTYRRLYGTDVAIARIFNTFGPRMRTDDGRVVPAFIAQALRNAPFTINGDGQQTRSLCYVTDIVEGLLALMSSTVSGPVNLGGTEELTVRELAESIAVLAGTAEPRFVFRPMPEDDPVRRRPDISLARTQLDWRPRTGLREGLQRTIEWYAARGGDHALRASDREITDTRLLLTPKK